MLSELSVQLRKLQNENNEKANEIDRLERQIRILAELKGVSIDELRNALRAACEGEAHGELRALIGKLQAKVDSSQLKDGSNGQKKFAPQDNSRERLALELRVGELEEIENTLRADMASLYEQISKLTANNTNLRTENVQLKAQVGMWERKWKAKEEEEIKKSSIVAVPMASTGSYNYSEFALGTSNTETDVDQLLSADQHRLLAAETALAGEKEHVKNLQSQMESTNKSYQLKLDQNSHRIQFLEGQIKELEQQMNSLYAAFEMMQADRTSERASSLMWKESLLQSDAALAREESEKEKGKQQQGEQQPFPSQKQNSTPIRAPHSSYSTSSKGILPHKSRQAAAPPARSVRPATHQPVVEGHLLLLLDNHNQPLLPQATAAATNSQSKRKLLLKTPSQRRKSSTLGLKKQYCVLHGSNGLYQIRYGDTLMGPAAGVHEFVTTGVSSVEHTERSSRLDFGFEIVINPSEGDSPSLCCAAETEEDFMRWMAALMGVVDGNTG